MKTLYLLMLILWEGAVSTWDAIWYRRERAQALRDAEQYENHGHE